MVKYFFEEYKKHKYFVWTYMAICVFTAIFTGPFVASNVLATESVLAYTQKISGSTLARIAGANAEIVGISCEPFTALFFIGLIEIVNGWLHILDITPTPAGNPFVFAVITVFFIASKVMKSNEATEVFGIITLGELEKYLGFFFVCVIGIMNVIGISTDAVNSVAYADNIVRNNSGGAGSAFVWIFSILWAIFMAISSLLVYVIIKTVMSALDIVQVSLSFIPGSAFIFQTIKTIFVFFIVFTNIVLPPLGIAINIIVFITCCILFGLSLKAIRYFKNIYMKPIFRRMRGFDPSMPLCSPKIPKKIRKHCEKNQFTPVMAIPVYGLRYIGKNERIKKFDRWWMVSDGNNTYFMKPCSGKKGVRIMNIQDSYQQPVCMHRGMWYFEIFSYIPTPQNMAKRSPKKAFSFVYSLEYKYRFGDLLKITKYQDYNRIKDVKKYNKRQLRESKKLQKREEFLRKFDEMKSKVTNNNGNR